MPAKVVRINHQQVTFLLSAKVSVSKRGQRSIFSEIQERKSGQMWSVMPGKMKMQKGSKCAMVWRIRVTSGSTACGHRGSGGISCFSHASSLRCQQGSAFWRCDEEEEKRETEAFTQGQRGRNKKLTGRERLNKAATYSLNLPHNRTQPPMAVSKVEAQLEYIRTHCIHVF